MEIYTKDNKALSYDSKYISPKVTSETWVLNEVIASDLPDIITIDFISNGQNFKRLVEGMTTYQRVMIYFFNLDDYNVEIVYGDYGEDPPKWNDQAYRTITFLESPTGDLLTWLQANGVKQ